MTRQMDSHVWQTTLVAALILNAVLGFVYRVYRLSRGGPMGDVIGQAALGVVLLGIAACLGLGAGWARWPALAYGLLFALLVMPIWTLAVLIPLPPQRVDWAFTGVYWSALALICIAAIAA